MCIRDSDFNDCIAKYIIDEFKRIEGIDLTHDQIAMQRIKEAGEKAKIELSTMVTTIAVSYTHLYFKDFNSFHRY